MKKLLTALILNSVLLVSCSHQPTREIASDLSQTLIGKWLKFEMSEKGLKKVKGGFIINSDKSIDINNCKDKINVTKSDDNHITVMAMKCNAGFTLMKISELESPSIYNANTKVRDKNTEAFLDARNPYVVYLKE